MAIDIESHTDEVKAALDDAIPRALEMCGLVAERYAKAKCPVDTGRLRNSLTHETHKNEEHIGTNVEYAPYVELGHMQTPGRYVPAIGKRLKKSHVSARPFLKPAITDHIKEYEKIIRAELSGGE